MSAPSKAPGIVTGTVKAISNVEIPLRPRDEKEVGDLPRCSWVQLVRVNAYQVYAWIQATPKDVRIQEYQILLGYQVLFR